MANKFRNSFTHREGDDAGIVSQGRVVNINLTKWTVDVVGQYDRKRWFDIQVSSPYLHYANGEGIFVVPEVGATVMVCKPSDGGAPFVLCFVNPPETIDDSSTTAPLGTSSHAQPPLNATNSTYSGGRPTVNPGDIWLQTRDRNFVILRRGGVLQIGSTALAQRLYIPLNNLVSDIAENYEMHNANGSIVWGLQDGPSLTQFPSQYLQTFRVFANDQYADVKIAWGKVYAPVPEPDGGVALAAAGVGQGDDGKGSNPIICEVTVSPKGFVAESGAPASAAATKASVFKFTFDRTGNVLMRAEGNLYAQVKKVLTLKVTKTIEIDSEDSISMTAANGIDINGGSYVHLQGTAVRLGAGTRGVARVGDLVNTLVAVLPVTITFAATPVSGVPCTGVLTTASPMTGSIISGNTAVLA